MKPWIRWLLVGVFAIIFCVCAWMLADYFLQSQNAQGQLNELSQIKQQSTLPPTQPTAPIAPSATFDPAEPAAPTEPPSEAPSPWVEVEDPKTGKTIQILREYADLYLMNTDMVGWMSIEGTKLDYPVMQRKNRTDYYLRKDFYGNYSGHGSLYAREACDVFAPSDNITIYGHNMKDGSMFAPLLKYRSQGQEFYEEHRYITFDTIYEHHTYEIFAAFTTTASVGKGFAYHEYADCTEEEFTYFVNKCKALSCIDSDVEVHYGDKLITLSTCEYTLNNGRFVVVAKRID